MAKLLIVLSLALGLLLGSAATAHAFDFFNGTNPNDVCKNTSTPSGSPTNVGQNPVCQTTTPSQDPIVSAIQVTTSIMALLAGAVAVIMIIIGGFQFVTSGGSTEAVTNARKKIVNSVIGLIIVAMAWTIIRLVTDRIIQ